LSGQQTFEFKACSGAVTDDVAKQADSLSYGQDAITVSSGGNDALLVTLLNQCIYGWHYTIGCDKARELSKNAILNDLPGRLDNLYTKLKAKLSRQGTVYVTAYGRFFDDTTTDCDKVSWHWWPWPLGVLNYQYLTQQRRTDLNALVDLVNTALQEAVNRAGDQFVLVTWDSAFGDFEGRYCEPSVQEPAPNRADLLFYLDGTQEQLNTKRQEENETFPESSFEGQVQALIEEGKREFPGNVTDPNVVQLISLPISDVRGRIFHPLQIGHSIIANKVLFEMSQRRGLILGVEAGVDVTDVAEVCPIIIPIGDDPTIHTDSDLNANFPKYWILTDGNQDIAALYFRMRDKACQRICDAATIQGVPSQFVRANRIGSTGCQYTIKISEEKEAYFYTTNDGQNCYDATEDMINAYGTSKDSSW
jgi:hypothetical protein